MSINTEGKNDDRRINLISLSKKRAQLDSHLCTWLRPVLMYTKNPGPRVAVGYCRARTLLGFR